MVQAAASLTSSLLAEKRRAPSGGLASADAIPPGTLLSFPRALPAVLPEPGRRAGGPVRRVKFTLRLEPEQHRRLKRAAVQRGQSGQRFLSDALERSLEQLSCGASMGSDSGPEAAARAASVRWPRKP